MCNVIKSNSYYDAKLQQYSVRAVYLLLGLASTGCTTATGVFLLSRRGRFALCLLLLRRLSTQQKHTTSYIHHVLNYGGSLSLFSIISPVSPVD